ncbi:MAG: hypothetical protein IJ979_04455, partial [Tidjanibacter sp.]|nr:hypothetical protein [Tidjanibacter sp.]
TTVVPATSEIRKGYNPHLTRGEAAGHIPRRGGGLGVGQDWNCLRKQAGVEVVSRVVNFLYLTN